MNKKLTDKDIKKHWNNNADVWQAQVRKGNDLFREYLNNPNMFKFIGDVNNKNILDAGCGEGYNTRKLAGLGGKLTGIDISDEMIKYAKSCKSKNKIDYFACSYSDLSIFENNSFDLIVSFMALMDGADYKTALKEFYKKLKIGGLLVFSITHPCFITPGLSWIKNEKGESIKLAVSDYFSKKHIVEKWTFSKSEEALMQEPFQVPTFNRTLSDYINPVIKTGFKIREIHEPQPSGENCKRFEWLKKWRKHAALFLYIKAEK